MGAAGRGGGVLGSGKKETGLLCVMQLKHRERRPQPSPSGQLGVTIVDRKLGDKPPACVRPRHVSADPSGEPNKTTNAECLPQVRNC